MKVFKNNKTNVLFICGGSGGDSIIQSFNNDLFNISSLINCYDDGKSTGKIRDLIKILGPSDIRKLQFTYLKSNNKNKSLIKLFDYRLPFFLNKNYEKNYFKKNLLNKNNLKNKFIIKNSNHLKFIFSSLIYFYNFISDKEVLSSNFSLINCIFMAEYLKTKNFKKTINRFSEIFSIKNEIVINSYSNKYLYAITYKGNIIGEDEIVSLNKNEKIKKIYILNNKINSKFKNELEKLSNKNKDIKLTKNINLPILSREAKIKIKSADIIVFCPGTQHSSLYPTYITKNFSEEIIKNKKALKVFVTNIHNDHDTKEYNKDDYILNSYKYLNFSKKYFINDFFDLNIVNKSLSSNKFIIKKFKNITNIYGNFRLSNKNIHNGNKIYDIILKYYKK